MKKLQLLFVLMLAALINTPIYAAYELVWEDTFSSVNTTAWSYETGAGGWGNGEAQYYTSRPENIKAENSNLVITARKESYGGANYTSARIKTLGKVSCKYGMIEARIKCPWGATGVWPAFWMMGENISSLGWPYCGEIDIMEQMCTSDPATWNTTLSTYHWNNNGVYGGYSAVNYGLSRNIGEQLGNAYRIYGVEWTPNALIGYIKDGNGGNRVNIVTMGINDATNDSNGRNAFHKEHFILLNMALGGSYTGYNVDPNFTSATMLVDWVRIYQDKVAYPQSTLTNRSNLTIGGGTQEPIVTETVAFKNQGTTLEQSKTYNFNVNYTVAEQRDLWVALYRTSNYDLIGESKVTVNKGSGTANLTINLNEAPVAGNDYILLTDIRPLNGAWTTRIQQEEMRNITISQNCQTTNKGVATFYYDSNYGGKSVALEEGTYTIANLAAYCLDDNVISSLKVLPGYKVTVYTNDNFTGTSQVFNTNTTYVGNALNDQISSIKIEAQGVSGFSGKYKIKGHNGLFLDMDGNATANATRVVQWEDEGAELYQQFEFTEVGNGVYSIASVPSGRVFDIIDASTANRTELQIYDNYNSKNQQFILIDAGGGYYQLVARHCGKVIEVPDFSTTLGQVIKLYDNNNQTCSYWNIQRYQQNTNYDYWILYKDNLSGISSYLDLRSNLATAWEGTLVDAPVSSTREGQNALSYTVNSPVGSWFGFGILNGATLDFSTLADYKIHFAYNTTYTGQMAVKLGGTNGEFSVNFNAIADGAWHPYEIPMSSFISKGMTLGSSTNNLTFSIVSENVVSTGAKLMIDDVFYYKSSIITPVVETEESSEKIIVYPTSVVDNIFVKSTQDNTVCVYDMLGNLKVQGPIQEGVNSINISFLSKGMYVLKLKNNQSVDGVLFIKQ